MCMRVRVSVCVCVCERGGGGEVLWGRAGSDEHVVEENGGQAPVCVFVCVGGGRAVT